MNRAIKQIQSNRSVYVDEHGDLWLSASNMYRCYVLPYITGDYDPPTYGSTINTIKELEQALADGAILKD